MQYATVFSAEFLMILFRIIIKIIAKAESNWHVTNDACEFYPYRFQEH